MIIDFHTHVFPAHMAARTVQTLSESGNILPHITPQAGELATSMARAGVDLSVALSVCTRAEGASRLNDALIRGMEDQRALGLITFGAAHPDMPDMQRELRRLRAAGIPGIKLHPAFQGCELNDPRMLRLMDAASQEGLIILCHGGMDVSYPDRNWASVPMLLDLLRQVRPEKLVMAHMGAWGSWDQVLQEVAGAPIWFDTAFCLGTVPRRDGSEPIRNMPDEAFVTLARAHGTDRILFGTDSPWSDQADYVTRLRRMPLTPQERDAILGENAHRLLFGGHTAEI